MAIAFQLNKLWSHPVAWFAQLPWLLRAASAVVVIPLITLSSIAWYTLQNPSFSATTQASNDVLAEVKRTHTLLSDNQIALLKEISDLKKELLSIKENLTNSKISELPSAKFDEDLPAKILGSSKNLSSSLTPTLPTLTESSPIPTPLQLTKLVSLNKDPIKIYDRPSDTAKEITSMTPDTILVVISKNDGWVELNIHQEKAGWVREVYTKEL